MESFLRPESDREKLVTIVNMTMVVLSELVNSREILFTQELRESVQSSWIEIQQRSSRFQGRIREISLFDLEQVGLSGSNLELKSTAIFESYERLNRRGGLKRAKKFLRWAKIVIGTMTALVPGLKEVAEILKEYMEAIEEGIDEAEAE